MCHDINTGGLYRCCVQTVIDDNGQTDGEGSILECPHCHETVILAMDGGRLVWKWNRKTLNATAEK